MTHMNKIKAIIAHNEITDSPQKNRGNNMIVLGDCFRKVRVEIWVDLY